MTTQSELNDLSVFWFIVCILSFCQDRKSIIMWLRKPIWITDFQSRMLVCVWMGLLSPRSWEWINGLILPNTPFKAFPSSLPFFCALPLSQVLRGGEHFKDREQQVRLWNRGGRTSSSREQVEEVIFCCMSNPLSHKLTPQDDSLLALWSRRLQAVHPQQAHSGGTVLSSTQCVHIVRHLLSSGASGLPASFTLCGQSWNYKKNLFCIM